MLIVYLYFSGSSICRLKDATVGIAERIFQDTIINAQINASEFLQPE